jgi:hypothetical protein
LRFVLSDSGKVPELVTGEVADWAGGEEQLRGGSLIDSHLQA